MISRKGKCRWCLVLQTPGYKRWRLSATGTISSERVLACGHATYQVQPCLLDMEYFSMMAVSRSSEKRWSRFSWAAVWLLMCGVAGDACGWCERWKLLHRSRLEHRRPALSVTQSRVTGKFQPPSPSVQMATQEVLSQKHHRAKGTKTERWT